MTVEKKKRTLGEYFSRYKPVSQVQRELFALAEDVRIRAAQEAKMVEVNFSLPKLFRKSVLYETEAALTEFYAQNSVRLFPHYPAELFSTKYMEEVLLEAKRIGSVVNGFFDRYEIVENGDNMEIHIPFLQGGIDLLDLAKTGDILTGIIRSEFGIERPVKIVQAADYAEQYKDYEAAREAWLREEAAQIPARQAAAAARAAEEAKSAAGDGENKPNLTRVASLFDGNGEAKLVDEGVIQCGRTKFDVSAPESLVGDSFVITDPVPLRSVKAGDKGITVLGCVFGSTTKENKNTGKLAVNIGITDRDSSIFVKTVITEDGQDELFSIFKNGTAVAIRCDAKVDKFDGEVYLQYADVQRIKQIKRQDNAEEKRVELHMHTCQSAMDATTKPDELVETAHRWGHRAVAITDHGNLQAFPTAMEKAEKLGMKVLYGVEAYFVDDTARAVFGKGVDDLQEEVVVFDIETTGLSPQTCKITEIGAVRAKGGQILEVYNSLVNPGVPIPEEVVRLTGITDEMVKNERTIDVVLPEFLAFVGDRMLVAHNANFDISFIRKAAEDLDIPFTNGYLDTVAMSRYVNPELNKHKLDTLATYFKLGEFNHHRASDDAEMLAMIYAKMVDKLADEGICTMDALNTAMSSRSDPLKLKTYHQIILVKNTTGLKNLYRLVSDSYLKYYRRNPRIPKTRLMELREGLIIGSACEAGELFTAVLEGKPQQELEDIASFYDYLEVQPITNNRFLVEQGKVADDEALRELNRKIIALGKKLGKPVVATCDAHYLDPEDEIFRRIILSGMKFSDADKITELYFRTTEEMLAEFDYLDPETAREIVIENPNKIADMIENVRPIPTGNYPPHIDGAEEELTEKCWELAKQLYGDPLPEQVSARLARELDSIIKNGFAIMYIIARKLVENSESKGYQVGSRGSVGSSFAATMAGITRVNPLPPHYRCPNCRYTEFIEDGSVGSGFDLPPKSCPHCGTDLAQDGHDIPFETFLGFNGDKTPDIDLNFSGDVQADAHKFTEVLFGAGKAFKAGTIGTLADKTAFGYTAHFLEDKGISVNRAEMERLIGGCLGTKRTTGQHPGGIIVVPAEYEIYDFTPVQHPADKADSDIITTHFEFKYLHDTILKLDILGHDIQTKYKRMEEYSGVPILDVPLTDPAAYRGFTSTEPIGVSPEQIDAKTSTLGLPEMGTKLSRDVLMEAQPKNFADLLQIEGLTHGTGMWMGNAQDLIRDGVCSVSEVIGCRDDIMLTLIQKYGVEKGKAFKIMEFVRKNKKGSKIPEDMMNTMLAQNVPQWYIDSLQKVRYMFPKAPAAAYANDALRLMWYKIYYPVEFYAGYFSAAPKGFDSEIVMRGKKYVYDTMMDMKKRKNEVDQKDVEIYNALMLVNEYYQRGFTFLPVDLQKSHAHKYVPENGKIRLPFGSLPGLGETAAENIMRCRDEKEIYSIEALKREAGISKTVVEILERNGVLKNLTATNQLTLF